MRAYARRRCAGTIEIYVYLQGDSASRRSARARPRTDALLRALTFRPCAHGKMTLSHHTLCVFLYIYSLRAYAYMQERGKLMIWLAKCVHCHSWSGVRVSITCVVRCFFMYLYDVRKYKTSQVQIPTYVHKHDNSPKLICTAF